MAAYPRAALSSNLGIRGSPRWDYHLHRNVCDGNIDEMGQRISTVSDAVAFFAPLFRYSTVERFVLVGLNPSHKIIVEIDILGCSKFVDISPKAILVRLAKSNAFGAVMAHNHPSGTCQPSEGDLDVTRELARGCKAIGIQCFDHLIFTEDQFLSLRNLKYL
jgi:DNA repair protein RadC